MQTIRKSNRFLLIHLLFFFQNCTFINVDSLSQSYTLSVTVVHRKLCCSAVMASGCRWLFYPRDEKSVLSLPDMCELLMQAVVDADVPGRVCELKVADVCMQLWRWSDLWSVTCYNDTKLINAQDIHSLKPQQSSFPPRVKHTCNGAPFIPFSKSFIVSLKCAVI